MKRKRYALVLLAGYLLGIHNGFLAVWKDEDPQPVRVYPYRASMFPPEDQKMLRRGISVHSSQELTRRIEDFCS